VTVYANGMQIGKLTSGVVAGVNTVPTSALVAGAEIKATQTTNNIEGCIADLGAQVAGGANPEIRVSFIPRPECAQCWPGSELPASPPAIPITCQPRTLSAAVTPIRPSATSFFSPALLANCQRPERR